MAAPSRPKGGLSLYDDLTDPNDTGATISGAPVRYAQNDQGAAASSAEGAAAAKKSYESALRFQPIRRPQAKQTTKPRGFFPKATATAAASKAPTAEPTAPPGDRAVETEAALVAPGTTTASASAAGKPTLADWAAMAEEDYDRYGPMTEKRQRGGRKRKKRKQELHAETNWDDIYDPLRPTNVEEYLRSDEKINEVREWRALLYRHRRGSRDSITSDEEESRPPVSNQFAPPPSYNFAPPPPSPPAAMRDGKLDSDADAAREETQVDERPEDAAVPKAYIGSATISGAPVRYAQPPVNTHHVADDDDDEDMDDRPMLGSGGDNSNNELDPEAPDAPRSNVPGQSGFAARLMSKYGWTKGTGLGADASGIVNPLRVQVDKRRKKADADGGGWAEPGGKGKIIGGKKRTEDAERNKFGTMSEVVVLCNMLENMPDLQAEIEDGLGQEIGEECGDKYGRVERLYIDQPNRQVFIKFTDQVSALRAVSELDGRVFNGNTIVPRFYNVEKFEKGIYQ